MRRGLFVTGTDTNVGKTVVCAALMQRYRSTAALRYWKPVQTGIESDDDTNTVRRLGECQDDEVVDRGVRLPKPLSPHLAARLAGVRIAIERLIADVADDFSSDERFSSEVDAPRQRGGAALIVEGAGGVLVPLNETDLMIDLIAALDLPALIVTRSALGTINHTLLTLASLRNRGLSIAGTVMVGDENAENRQAIETYGATRVVAEMPRFDNLDGLGVWAREQFDRQALLLPFLR